MEGLTDKKNILIILIVVIILSAVVVLYYLFLKPEPGIGLAETGFVANPSEFDALGIPEVGSMPDVGMTGDLMFMLSQLESITLENKLEGHPGFSGLLDHTVNIEPRDAGRENPFDPYVGRPVFSSDE